MRGKKWMPLQPGLYNVTRGSFHVFQEFFSVFFRTNTVSQRKNKKSLLGTVELSKEQDKAN